jgi:hypothetical protein
MTARKPIFSISPSNCSPAILCRGKQLFEITIQFKHGNSGGGTVSVNDPAKTAFREPPTLHLAIAKGPAFG